MTNGSLSGIPCVDGRKRFANAEANNRAICAKFDAQDGRNDGLFAGFFRRNMFARYCKEKENRI